MFKAVNPCLLCFVDKGINKESIVKNFQWDFSRSGQSLSLVPVKGVPFSVGPESLHSFEGPGTPGPSFRTFPRAVLLAPEAGAGQRHTLSPPGPALDSASAPLAGRPPAAPAVCGRGLGLFSLPDTPTCPGLEQRLLSAERRESEADGMVSRPRLLRGSHL